MVTTWTIEVDWERTGNFNGTYDDITDYVMDARWFTGFRRPYQDVADEQMLSLTVSNSEKRFSPENSSRGKDNIHVFIAQVRFLLMV